MINITPFPLGQGYPPKINKIRSYIGYNLKLLIFNNGDNGTENDDNC